MNIPNRGGIYWSALGLIVFGFFISSCKNEVVNVGPQNSSRLPTTSYIGVFPKDKNVFIAGWTDQESSATLWNGDIPKTLPTKLATSVFVSGQDVYVAGTDPPRAIAMYWKNDSAVVLSQNGIATSIAVSGRDVYVGGYNQSAMYWKNGIPMNVQLSDSAELETKGSAIFTSGKDVYLAGSSRTSKGNLYATFWKNGKPVYLRYTPGYNNSGQYSFATSIFVSGDDVYVCGMVSDPNFSQKAVYWKNGLPMALDSMNSGAMSIFVSGIDVYVAGFNTQGGVYWKNGIPVSLSPMLSSAMSICVANGDVYVAGYTINNFNNKVATYWKNGVATTLKGPLDSQATSIAVKSSP